MDLSGDQGLIDDTESVTLNSDGGPFGIDNVSRSRDDSVNQDHAGGGYYHRDTRFHLPVDPVDIYHPKVGDTIVDAIDAITWHVLDVRQPKHNDCWIVAVRQPHISSWDVALHDRVSLWPAVEEPDDWGSTITKHPIADAAFAIQWAAITLRPSVVVDEMAQRDFVEIYDIHIAIDTGQLHEGDLLKDQDGKQYTIVSYRNRQQIDELSVIVCEDRIR